MKLPSKTLEHNPAQSFSADRLKGADFGRGKPTEVKYPNKVLEKKLYASGYVVIAVDEVGMGSLAGPVVVCAVSIAPDFYRWPEPGLRGVTDSKLLRAREREEYARILKRHPYIRWAMASSSPAVIDKINILQASHRAMRQAIGKLIKDSRDSIHESKILNREFRIMVLVDGNKKISGLAHQQKTITKGDRKVFAIACASIIAKVHRDNLMIRYAKKYPGYGLEVHKGYGTIMHRRRIKELGKTSLHRRTFDVK